MRHLKSLATLLSALSFTATSAAAAPAPRATAGGTPPPAPARTVYDFQARRNDGTEVPLARWKGKVLLIVNTASRCGFTRQYAGLETLAERYRDRGFEVLAFPSNDFMNQEPGSDAEIAAFCAVNYHTTFPLFAKIAVKGKRMHPLYAYLTGESPYPGAIGWNFTKFLVGPDGRVAARFDTRVKPESPEVVTAIERLLPKP